MRALRKSIGVFFALILAIVLWMKVPSDEEGSRVEEKVSSSVPNQSNPPSSLKNDEIVISKSGNEKQESLISIPSLDQVREEVRKDPHRTADSIIEFSIRLAPQISRSLKDKKVALQLFDELEKCAEDPAGHTPVAVRGVCDINMRRLSEKYPDEFGVRYKRARRLMEDRMLEWQRASLGRF